MKRTKRHALIAFFVFALSLFIGYPAVTQAGTLVDNVYITYNANGGKTAGGNTDIKKAKTTAKYGKTINLYNFGSFGLSRAGYSRKDGKEWNTKADGTGLAFDQGANYAATKFGCTKLPSGSYIAVDKKMVLYAQWTPNKYTVKFNGNGGTASSASKEVTYHAAYGTLPTATKTGYTLAGWYTAKSGGTKITEKSKLTTAGTTTLYAHWTANKYTIKFNGNGGTSSMPTRSVTYASAYGPLPLATRAGYTFAGWYTAKTDGAKITEKTTVSVTGTTTLYAHWTANKYNVTYYLNGGQCSSTSKSVVYGQEIGSLATPTKTGYTFVSWYDAPTNGKKVTESTKLPHAGNFTVYAYWKANTYTIEYYDNSTLLGQSTHTYDVDKSLNPNTATKAGYKFSGWSTTVDGIVKYSDRAAVKNLSSKSDAVVKLYAIWVPDSSQTSFSSTLENDYNNFRFKNNSEIPLNKNHGVAVKQQGRTTADGEIEYDGYVGKGFCFYTTGNNSFYEIKLLNLSYSGSVTLAIFDSNGNRIDDLELEQSVASTGKNIVKLNKTSAYYAIVYADNGDSNFSGIASVSITEVKDDAGDAISEASPIELNTEMSAYLNGTNDVDCFSFVTSVDNGYYYLNLKNISVTSGLNIELYDSKNILVKEMDVDDSASDGCLLKLGKNQKYTLVFSGEYDVSGSQYLFSVDFIPDDVGDTMQEAQSVTLGTDIYGKIDGPDDTDMFVFDPTGENAYYLLSFYNDTSLSINVRLKNEKGEIVSEYSASNGSADISDEILAVTKNQKNYIEVSVEDNDNETGEYHFSATKIVDDHGSDAQSATVMTAGTKLNGYLELDENIDMFSFNTRVYSAYDFVITNESTSGGLDYEILNSSQTVLASDTVSANQTAKLEGEDCVNVSKNQTCYVKVTGLKDTKYTIYFKPTTFSAKYYMNGGTNSKVNPDIFYKGNSYTLVNPTRSGYKFLGWYDDSDFYTQVKKIDGSNDVELYAAWEKNPTIKVKTYKVTYVMNGGTNNKSNVTSFKTGQKIKYQKPTRKKYIFKGWYSDKELAKKVTATTGTGNCTVYAKWSKVSVPKVTGLKISSIKNKYATVSYKKASGCTYEILYSTNSKFKNSKKVTLSGTSKKVTSLSKNKKYYVKVRAVKKDSTGSKVYGSYSAVKTFKTKK